MFKNLVRYSPDDGAGGASGEGSTTPATPADWDAYVASLPAEQQTVVTKLYTDKNQALLNSVKATRDERDDFGKQLREAAKKLEKGSDAEKQLTTQADELDEANRRADFYEVAPTKECLNPKAAYALAKAGGHFSKAGVPDWNKIKEEAPQLFGVISKPKGKGGAGAGTGEKPAAGGTMNDWIRQQAKTITSVDD